MSKKSKKKSSIDSRLKSLEARVRKLEARSGSLGELLYSEQFHAVVGQLVKVVADSTKKPVSTGTETGADQTPEVVHEVPVDRDVATTETKYPPQTAVLVYNSTELPRKCANCDKEFTPDTEGTLLCGECRASPGPGVSG